MALKKEMSTVVETPNEIINAVESNLFDFKIAIKDLSKDEKESIINKCKSSQYKKYLLQKKVVSIKGCMLGKSTISGHINLGEIKGDGLKIAKSLDFYSFYFPESLNQWYERLDRKEVPITKKKNLRKLIGGILLLGIIGIIGYIFIDYLFSNKDVEPTNITAINKEIFATECKLDSSSIKHKILILPFKYVKGNKWTEDKGYFLMKRLDSLNKADNLNLEVKFCRTMQPTNYDEFYYQSIMNSSNADQIIYGFLDENNGCSNDYVCLNYIAKYDIVSDVFDSSFTNNNSSSFKNVSNFQLSAGALQKEMDYLMYFNASVGAFKNNQWNKVLRYTEKIVREEKEGYGSLYFMRGLSYFNLHKPDPAIYNYVEAIKDTTSRRNFHNAYSQIGHLFLIYDRLDLAKKYLDLSFKKERTFTYSKVFRLYYANKYLGLHQDNIDLLHVIKHQLENNNETEPNEIIYRRALSNKMLGNDLKYKREIEKLIEEIGSENLHKIIDEEKKYITDIRSKGMLSYMNFQSNPFKNNRRMITFTPHYNNREPFHYGSNNDKTETTNYLQKLYTDENTYWPEIFKKLSEIDSL